MRAVNRLWLSLLWWQQPQITFAEQQTLASPVTTFIADSLPFAITPRTVEGTANYTAPLFPILPFTKHPLNPVLQPNPSNDWESTYLYNPTAVILNETIFLLYRAQNAKKNSSIGIAWSTDGTTFTRLREPLLSATEEWELGGGTEDPRLVRVNGTFYLTYTAYDLNVARLCLATSTDLVKWKKYPPLFPHYHDVHYSDYGMPYTRFNYSKSGAIVTEPTADGLYHMYFGDSFIYHATSRDLLNWTALPAMKYFAAPDRDWEDILIEPGPAPIKTRDGRWLLIYNGKSSGAGGYGYKQYSAGQMLIDPSRHFQQLAGIDEDRFQPATIDGPVARLERPFLWPDKANEVEGQVNKVVFAEGLVQFKGKWWLYYGQGDSELGVATADVQP